jgi:transcriptional regulator with XRE-family HTH domain
MEKRYDQEIRAFGKRLKQLREAKELSQLDLEIESGINRTEISRIENGLKNIEFLTIVKLSAALNVEISDFFSRTK